MGGGKKFREHVKTGLKRRCASIVAFAAIILCVTSFFMFSPGNASVASFPPALPTHFYFLLDRSGSMHGLENDVVGGFNGYLAEQQREVFDQPSLITLIQFDSNEPHQVTIDAQQIMHTRPLGSGDYRPRGSTPLYDAIGETIRRAERNGQTQKENVVIIIFTDGQENSSLRDDQTTVSSMISQKKEEGWAFVFMGANVDAFAEASKAGISQKNSQNFVPDSEGVSAAFHSVAGASAKYQRTMQMNSGRFFGGANPEMRTQSAESIMDGFDEAQTDWQDRHHT